MVNLLTGKDIASSLPLFGLSVKHKSTHTKRLTLKVYAEGVSAERVEVVDLDREGSREEVRFGRPDDLDGSSKDHSYAELTAQPKPRFTMQTDDFYLLYRLWIEDAKWTGQGTTNAIPAPTNLRLAKDANDMKKAGCDGCDPQRIRALVWDWSGLKEVLDSFIVYRSYSCPGQDTQIMAPQMVVGWGGPPMGLQILPRTEPVGCAVRYQVSAFGPPGESAAAKLETQTPSSIARVQVTFKDMTSSTDTGASIGLYVNQYKSVSDKDVSIKANTTLDLSQVSFAGKIPNNALTVNLDEGEFLQISLWTGFCQPRTTVAAPAQEWKGYRQTLPLAYQADGGRTCRATVEVNGLEPVAAGQIARPRADIFHKAVPFLIGKDVYVKLRNGGPDKLPANRVELMSYWLDPNTKQPVDIIKTTTWWPALMEDVSIKVGSLKDRIAADLTEDKFYVEVKPLDFDDPDLRDNSWGKPSALPSEQAPPAGQPAAVPPPVQPQAVPPPAQPSNCQPGKTATRFVNDASFSVISLGIDGKEVFQTPFQEIPYNRYLEVELQPGQRQYSLQIGRWKLDGTREPYYEAKDTFTQPDKTTCTIIVPQPTIQQLLTRFTGRGCWSCNVYSYETTDPGTGLPLIHYEQMAFCFNGDGTLQFYKGSPPLSVDNSTLQEDGTCSYASRDPSQYTVTFQATGKKSGITVQGTYYELAADLRDALRDPLATGSYLKIANGPGGQALYYWPIK